MKKISREEFRETLNGLIEITKKLKKDQQGVIVDEKEILLDIIEYLIFELGNSEILECINNKNNNITNVNNDINNTINKQSSTKETKDMLSIFDNVEISNNVDISKVKKGGIKTTDPSMETLQKKFFELLEKHEDEDYK